MSKGNDLSGKRFGRLVVIKSAEMKGKNKQWLCVCDCGETKTVLGYNISNGHTKSCGCLTKEIAIVSNSSHGMSKSRFYQIWRDMLDRTTRLKNVAYDNYGGRGIKVCQEWRVFENFMNEMHESYLQHAEIHGELSTTIDRINNDEGYLKTNCRWATPKFQSLNKRSNLKHSVNGKLLTVKEISDIYGLAYAAVRKRVSLGWAGDDLISPSKRRGSEI